MLKAEAIEILKRQNKGKRGLQRSTLGFIQSLAKNLVRDYDKGEPIASQLQEMQNLIQQYFYTQTRVGANEEVIEFVGKIDGKTCIPEGWEMTESGGIINKEGRRGKKQRGDASG